MRDLNRALVLEAIRHDPGIARAEIAAATGLTAATITNIVAALIGEGAVQELAEREARALGQPVRRLHLIAGYAATIGLHFDHEFATGVLVDVAGQVIADAREQLSMDDPARALRVLATLCQRLRDHPRRQGSLRGVGVSAMGALDSQRGLVCQSAEYPAWRGFGFRDALAQAVGLPLHIENNGTAAALGEYWFGSGRALGSYLNVFVGNGLAGALLMDRRAVRGLSGNAWEIGHVNAYPDGQPCFCGARGCLETVVSLRGLAEALGHTGKGAMELGTLHARVDAALAAWVAQAGADLGRVITGIANLADVTEIVINGLLPAPLLQRLVERTRAVAAVYEMKGKPAPLNFRIGQANSELAAALGAATLPLYGNLF